MIKKKQKLHWYDYAAITLVSLAVIWTAYSSFYLLPQAMAECEAKGLELAHCDQHCGCVHYGCVNKTEQYENEHMGCVLI